MKSTIEYRHGLGAFLPHMANPDTQVRWNVFLKALEGLPLSDEELVMFREMSGRTDPRAGGYPEAVAIVGRQAGKDDICADLANARAVRSILDREDVDGLYISLVAQDHRSSIRTIFHRVSRPWRRVEMLKKHVVASSADSLTLDNGLTIVAMPCRPQALRGSRNLLLVMNETEHYRSSQGNPVDVEMRRAGTPTVATTGGRVIIVSSPYTPDGLLGTLHRRHYGKDDSPTLVIQGSAPDFNPTLPADYLERMREDDPEAYRSEVLGEFRAGDSMLLPSEAVDDMIDAGVFQRPRVSGQSHVGWVDPGGGRNDETTLAVCHAEGEQVVVDAVRGWKQATVAIAGEIASALKFYGVSRVTGDHYGADNTVEALRREGIFFEPRPAGYDASRLYLEFAPLALTGRVRLVDDPVLARQLRGLRRRRGFAGRDKVDHYGAGSHDDRAAAVAGAVWLAAKPRTWVGTVEVLGVY